MTVSKASAAEFLALFAGQASAAAGDLACRSAWRDGAEDLAAFLVAHEEVLPDTASFMTLLQVGGLLILEAERSGDGCES